MFRKHFIGWKLILFLLWIVMLVTSIAVIFTIHIDRYISSLE